MPLTSTVESVCGPRFVGAPIAANPGLLDESGNVLLDESGNELLEE